MATKKRERLLKTPDDVFEHFSVDTEPHLTRTPKSLEDKNAELSRRVYKATSCGAWAEIASQQEARLKREVWEGLFERTTEGWEMTGMRKAHGPKKWSKVAPAEVFEFFDINFMPADERASFARGYIDGEGLPAGTQSFIARGTFNLPANQRDVWWFRVGSIVEGVDATTQTYEVRLPTTAAEINKAIEDVEREASDLWDLTHGCEDCWGGKDVDAGYGSKPVDPNCKSCHGDGISI